MSKISDFSLRAAVLSCLGLAILAAPSQSFAGEVRFNGNIMQWHSTLCEKPEVPPSWAYADPETAGNRMNAMQFDINMFAERAQKFMDCVSIEAENDQKRVNSVIANDARVLIQQTYETVRQLTAPRGGR
ncbi:MAG: hypothetical protein FWF23_01585 [Alphaproteobacteria bacterium]|nr:hypothetical protein [Alphaproteobacteria bacterium]MCL2505008.1 hypothetical protein [Alphaproteobacteria bacterium]